MVSHILTLWTTFYGGKREITKIDVCGGQIVNHWHVFSWSCINPRVHPVMSMAFKRFSSPSIPALSCKCLVFNELMLYWLLFEYRSMLLLYANFLMLEFEIKRLWSLTYNFLCQMILTMWSCIVYRDMLISKPEQIWPPDVNISNPL